MDKTTPDFDAIMHAITSGLTGEPSRDIAYLMRQCEAHRDHPLGPEVIRACGRLIWDLTPQESRARLARVMDGDRSSVQTVLDAALACLKAGRPRQALRIVEPEALRLAQLMESGWCASDSQGVYLDLRSPIEEVLWRTHNQDLRELRLPPVPCSRVFHAYATCLGECGRHQEARTWLERAVHWDPACAELRLDLVRGRRRLGDLAAARHAADSAHPYVATPANLARYHRELGFIAFDEGRSTLACAHLVTSLRFERSQEALERLGDNPMTPDEASRELSGAGEPVGPNARTVSALVGLIRASAEDDDCPTVIKLAFDLHGITGDERYAVLARRLTSAIEAA